MLKFYDVSTVNVFSNPFSLIGNLKILELLKLLIDSNIQFDVMQVASTFHNIQGTLNTFCTSIFTFFFGKYCPEDGPLRPKLVANISITIIYYIVVSDGLQV